MIEDLAVISESHLEDPDGAVERRLRMYSRSDVLQIKELEDILATPSPMPSEIVRHRTNRGGPARPKLAPKTENVSTHPDARRCE